MWRLRRFCRQELCDVVGLCDLARKTLLAIGALQANPLEVEAYSVGVVNVIFFGGKSVPRR